jgi:hypothetical protein
MWTPRHITLSETPSRRPEAPRAFRRVPLPAGEIVAAAVAVAIGVLLYFYHDRFFKWLDVSIARYWAFAGGSFGLLTLAAFIGDSVVPRFLRPLQSRVAFGFLLAAALVAFRWPSVSYNHQLDDPDESQLLAGAITLTHDPVFFRSVDGTTHGPLDQYILTLPRLFGVPIDFLSGRSVLLMLNWLAVVGCWLALRTFLPERMARLGALSALAFYAFNTFPAFVQCGTEDLPAALTMLGLGFLCRGLKKVREDGSAPGEFFIGAACLGAVPFAKLQGTPPAAWLGLSMVAILAFAPLTPRSKRIGIGALLIGAVTPTVVFLIVFAATGMFRDFWQAYIVNNVTYAQQKHHSHYWMLTHFYEYLQPPAARPFFVTMLCVTGVGVLALPKRPRAWTLPLVLIAGCAVFSLAAVIAPGRAYWHYLRLLIVPAAALAAATAGLWQALPIVRKWSWGAFGVTLAFAVATLVPQVDARFDHHWILFHGMYRTQRKLEPCTAARLVLKYARPGDSLGMWGWEPRIYVETQLWQATREAHTDRQVEASPQLDYYRERFLHDLKASRPPVFVDAVGEKNFVMQNREMVGHEVVPEVRDLVAENYRLVGDVDGFRIYVRNDRLDAAGK